MPAAALTDAPDPPPPSLCAACGADLGPPLACCDHGIMTRGEVRWVEEPRPDPAGARPKPAPGGAAALAAIGGWLLYLWFFAAAPQPGRRDGPLMYLMALLCSLGPVAMAISSLRTRPVPDPGAPLVSWRASGEANAVANGRAYGWLWARGTSVLFEEPRLQGPVVSSAALFAHKPQATSFALLRAALLALAAGGFIRLRIAHRASWVRSRGTAAQAPSLVPQAIEFASGTAAASGALPWLEDRLLVALQFAEARAAADPPQADEASAGQAGSPYRSAPAKGCAPQAAWVELGDLLRTFHRQERAHLFHHQWLRDRLAESGSDTSAEGEGRLADLVSLQQRHAALWSLLGGPSLRRASAHRPAPPVAAGG